MSAQKPPVLGKLPVWQVLLLLGIAIILATVFDIDLFQVLETDTPTVTTPAAGELPEDAVPARLIQVVDGDTIEVEVNGQRETVRYIGIDTPERGEPGYQAATEANRRLLDDGNLFLARDRSDRDQYGRLLRYVYNAEGVFVNAELIFQGYAQPIEFPPDVSQALLFRRLAKNAAESGRGFWSGQAEPDGASPYGLTLVETKLREGAGRNQPIRGVLAPGTPLTILGRSPNGNWLLVRTPDRARGWVEADQIQVNLPLDMIPEATPGAASGGRQVAPLIRVAGILAKTATGGADAGTHTLTKVMAKPGFTDRLGFGRL